MMKNVNFKESKFEWFGDIPSHWETVPLKHLLEKIYTGGTPTTSIPEYWSDSEEGFNWVAISDISKSNGTLTETSKKITQKGLESKNLELIPKGTMLLSIFASLGKTTRLGIDATVNQAIIGLEPNEKLEGKYLQYLFEDCERYISFYSSANTQENLNVTKIKDLIFPVPTLSEQQKIATFLDQKTAEIDTIIAKKENLLLLLEEKKKAIVNETLTKGLNPNAKMKDSGIEWIGEIPENWAMKPLKYLTEKIGSGVTPRGGAEVYVDEGIQFIRSQNVYFDGLRLDDVVCIDRKTHNKMENSQVYKYDVLLNITGGSIGRSCVVELNKEFNVNQHVCIIRCNNELLPHYLNYLLFSDLGQNQIRMGITGGNREGLNFENLKSFIIPNPKIGVQERIVFFLNDFVTKSDLIRDKIMIQIMKLKEYRQSLISEAVTGKISI